MPHEKSVGRYALHILQSQETLPMILFLSCVILAIGGKLANIDFAMIVGASVALFMVIHYTRHLLTDPIIGARDKRDEE